MTIKIKDISELESAAQEFVDAIGDRRVFAFRGDMGAGKTTFISAVCRALGVDGEMAASPSFSIINEYVDSRGEPLYHFDFYRIDDVEEGAATGAEEYFDSGALCFVEWPERIEPLLPEETVDVSIRVNADGSRLIEF